MEFPALNRRALLPQRTAEFKHQLPLHPNRGKNRAHQVQQNNTTRHGSSMLSHCGILCIEATHRRVPNQHQHPLPQTGGIKPGPNGRLQQISIHASTWCLFKMQWPIQLQTVSNNTTFSLRYAKAVYKILHLTISAGTNIFNFPLNPQDWVKTCLKTELVFIHYTCIHIPEKWAGKPQTAKQSFDNKLCLRITR